MEKDKNNFYNTLDNISILPFEKFKIKKENLINNNLKEFENINLLKTILNIDEKENELTNYFNINNLNKNEISVLFSEIKTIRQSNFYYQDWIYNLKDILKKIDNDYINKILLNNNYEIPFYHLLLPFVEEFSQKILINLNNKSLINNNLIQEANNYFINSVIDISTSVFIDEFLIYKNGQKNSQKRDKIYKEFVKDILNDNYKDIFLKYPIFARKLTQTTNRLSMFVSNIINRYFKDKEKIEKHFNTSLGKIIQINYGFGDMHNGASTVILEFENNIKLVYKPINVEITDSYNLLLNWVNDELNENLKTFKVLNMGEYGWIEFIEYEKCENECDIKTYYRRAGILCGLSYFLNSRDYHNENVIAAGDCPVLIDHETIIGPDIKFESLNEYVGTVFESLLIPANNENRNRCGFGFNEINIQNFYESYISECNTDNMSKSYRLAMHKEVFKNIPKIKNKNYFINNYSKDFLTGFKKIYKIFYKNKDYLTSNNSPIQSFSNKQIRILMRNTRLYIKLIKKLNKNEIISNSNKFGFSVELLSYAYIKINRLAPFLKYERESIILEDVPVFYTSTSDNKFKLPNGELVDLFNKNAIESVKLKIMKSSTNDFKAQLNYIRQSLNC